jgi:serine protease Do
VIGINAAIYGKGQGIGFAIPIDRAKRVLQDLVSYGEVKRSWIGVVTQDLTPELAQHFGVKKGVVVAVVEPKSPAARAGLVRGDLVLKVDGREVGSADEFEGRIAGLDPGQEIRLTVSGDADGAIRDIDVAVTAFPDADADDLLWSRIGFAAEGDGLVVSKVRSGSPAARIGLRRGDRILGLAGSPVKSTSELRRRMIEVRGARNVVLTVGRGPYEYNVQVPLARE